MTKKELINKIAEKTDLTKVNASKALNSMLKAIMDTNKNGRMVTLIGFGTFKVAKRKARKGRNPMTGEIINIPDARVPRFIAGKEFREAVKNITK